MPQKNLNDILKTPTPDNTETARKVDPKKELDWYLRSRPTQGVRTREGDRSSWNGSSGRGQNWGGGREI